MKRRLAILLSLLCLVFNMVAPFINPGQAAADPLSTIHAGTFSFTDQAHVTGNFGGSIGQVIFTDKNTIDGNHNYVSNSKFCQPANGTFGITLSGKPNWSAGSISAVINVGYRPTTTGSCQGTQFNISISNPGGVASNNAVWDGANIVFPLPGQSDSTTFKSGTDTSTNDLYLANATNDTCGSEGSVISLTDSSHGTAFGEVVSGGGGQHAPSDYPGLAPYFKDSACTVHDPVIPINIGGTKGTPAAGGAAASSGSSDGTSIGCHVGAAIGSVGGLISAFNPLNWLICGVIEGLSDVIGFLDSAIESQLAIGANSDSPDQAYGIFCKNPSDQTGSCASYHVAWVSFRDIALGLMLIVGLIILISQALGFEALDAYAIRKALPRLLIAAVTITLSWQLMQFAVALSNDLGYGVRHIIEAPFCQTLGGCNVSVNPFTLGNNLFSPALLVIGSFGIMTLAAAGALSLFIAYTVLVLRQIVVILLIIVAPIAIIAYVLPGTNRTYKLWWESFSKALLMFPLITGMIAVGHVFAVISSKNVDTLSQTIAFFAYFAPYFMLPSTFSMAGAAIGGLGNAINSRAAPVYGMLSRKRGEHAKGRWNKARDGNLWHKDWGKFDKSGTKAGRAYNKFQTKLGRPDRQLAGSIGKMGDRAAAWATDADQLVPAYLGKERTKIPFTGIALPGGRKFSGVPTMKRYSPALYGRIADQVVEQSNKRAQTLAGIHYLGQRGMAGDYEYLDTKTQEKLESAGFGHIMRDKKTGERVTSTNRLGQKSYVWDQKKLHDGSLSDTKKMSQILMDSSKDKERLAGREMYSHRGAIATFSDPEEFRFADLQTGALMNLAAAGRAEQLDVNANDLTARLGPEAGDRIYKTLADTDSRIRVEARHGYGVVAETTPDGSIRYVDSFSDEIDPRTGEEYYKGQTAATSLSSAGYHAWSSAKGESVARAAKAFEWQLKRPGGQGGQWTEEQLGFLNQINTGLTSYGGDPGMQREWKKIADQIGGQLKDQKLDIPPELLGRQARPTGKDYGEAAEQDAADAARRQAAEDAEQPK